MYCKKCGKALDTDAKFCSNCGTKVVREEEPFVPAFMKSYGIEKEQEEKPKRKTYERENFDWHLDGFPDPNKKTEEVDFNWSSVLEHNQRRIYGLEKDRERTPLYDPEEMSFDEDTMAAYEAKSREREAAAAQRAAEAAAAEEAAGKVTEEAETHLPETEKEVKDEAQAAAEKEFEELLNSVPELKESEYEIPDSLFKGLEDRRPEPIVAEPAVSPWTGRPIGASEPEQETAPVEEEAAAVSEPAGEQEKTPSEAAAAQKSLEEEIFGDMISTREEDDIPAATIVAGRKKADEEKVDKFYTFNQKKTELQALLDREYARLEKLNRAEEKLPKLEDIVPEEETPEAAPLTVEAEAVTEDAAEVVTEAEPDNAPAEERVPVLPPLEYVGVQLACAPAGVYVTADEKPSAGIPKKDGSEADGGIETDKSPEDVMSSEKEKSREALPSKAKEKGEGHKLTFGDIFDDDDDGYDEDEGSSKKGGCLRAIAILLCIVVVIQLAMIGIQYFIPESQPAKIINRGYSKVLSLISGEKEPANPVSESSELENIIKAHASENKNIAAVGEDASLAFENGQDYGFDNFEDTYKYENAPWYTDDDDKEVTYLDGVVSTLIRFHSAWVDKMDDGSDEIYDYVDSTSPVRRNLDAMNPDKDVVYSIESLDIGEIRFDGTGFYVMTKVVYVNSGDTDKSTEQQVVYLEPDNEMMKVISIVVL
ncbi:MAG: zinc-ribbon domain-containing protein [Emergencia sp.]